MATIAKAVKTKKCCSCGVCVGACPKHAIKLILEKGIATPQINNKYCIECGICYTICPGVAGVEDSLKLTQDRLKEYIVGSVRKVCNAHSKDELLLKSVTSGGVVTTLIKSLVGKSYDAAFMVGTDKYDNIVYTTYYDNTQKMEGTSKSRYISVSQEQAISHMLSHRNEKLIIVGTSCAIRGISTVINKFHLVRSQYLLVGLFCDKTMTYNVWNYFSKLGTRNEELLALYFRDKGVNGWPGGVKLKYETKQKKFDKRRRSEVKDFFCHPRCLYCVDKLNIYSDLSIGDNYTKENAGRQGSSSIIIRTESGSKAFELIQEKLNVFSTNIDKIYRSQECDKKWENSIFAKMRFKHNLHFNAKTKMKYYYKYFKMKVGASRLHNSKVMKWLIVLDRKLKG